MKAGSAYTHVISLDALAPMIRDGQLLHLQEVLVGAKSRMAPLELAEVKTVRQALMEVQSFIDQSIGRRGNKSSAESGKPMRRKKAVVKNAQGPASRKSSGKPRRPGR